MNSELFKRIQINILYTFNRKSDAQNLYFKYSCLGAKAILIEVEKDKSTITHTGKLYFFGKNPELIKLGDFLVKDISDIEVVSLSYHPMVEESEGQPNFSIWLVRTKPLKEFTQYTEIVSTRNKVKTSKPSAQRLSPVLIKTSVTKPKTSMINCPKCHSMVREDRVDKHLKKAHEKVKKVPQKNVKRQPKVFTIKADVKSLNKSKSIADKNLILISRRGTRANEKRRCDTCNYLTTVWRYSKSSQGEVYLCGRCKSGIFNRSFGRVDAMRLAYQGGLCDKNRSRH